MEALTLDRETDSKREIFFRLLFGEAKGTLCIAFTSARGEKNFSEEFYSYPEELSIVTRRINEEVHGSNIYFCSQLLSEKRRVKETVDFTTNIWADLDRCPPEKMLVEPSIVLETSPDKYQAFWVLDQIDYGPDDIEELSRRISYKHKDDGADNGWALTKLLRVPFTYNYKYNEPKIVKTIVVNRNEYSPLRFDIYPVTDDYIKIDLPLPAINYKIKAEDILEENKENVTDIMWSLFNDPPMDGADWSKRLWRLIMLLHEHGFESEQVFIIALSAACNKYKRDSRPAMQLWKDVVRAKIKIQLTDEILARPDQTPTILLTDEERAIVETSKPTFVERYIDWATRMTDAAPQYHGAGALVALSSVLSGSVKLPTSFGSIVPNIWVMILGTTTVTRKTSSMDLAMELIMDVDDEIVLATDGSIEGLLTSLSTRPGRPSIFLRDEFSGLLDQMTKKDYLSGMAELLTKLYDCKMQKRVLKSGIVEVRNPRLTIYGGGISDNITLSLNTEHISSGFIPRFIFIIGENDLSRLRPMGPPTQLDLEERTMLLDELQNLYDHYNQMQQIAISQNGGTISQKVEFEVSMTESAWKRYNELETKMLQEAMDSEDVDVMVPMNDRLSKSILKCAILIAASRQISDSVVIEKIDIIRAAKYGESWIADSRIIISNVSKGTNERFIEKIMAKIARSQNGIKRSTLMRQMHLSARETAWVLETLKQRDLISTMRAGQTEIITATTTLSLTKEERRLAASGSEE